jgi:hypothetical protein
MAVLRNQWADQGNQLGGGSVLHLDYPGLQLVATGRPTAGFRLGFGVRYDPRDITLSQYAESMRRHYRKEQLIDLAQRQGRIGYHADLALHSRIDDERLAAELADLINERADVGVLEVDGPAVLLIRTRFDTRFGCDQGQWGGQQAGG